MKFILLLFIFLAVVLLEMTFLASFFATTLPLLQIMVGIIMLVFLGSQERFGWAIIAGLIVDILHSPTAFIHLPFFTLMAGLMWLWDTLFKLEEPVLTISRAALGFLVWPIFLAFVGGAASSGIGIAAREAIFRSSQVILGRDVVFGLLAIGAVAVWQFYGFTRQRQKNLSHLF